MAEKLNVDYDLIVGIYNECRAEIHEHKMTIEEFLKKNIKTTRDIVEEWKKIYFENLELDSGVLEIIEKLKGKYVLAIISNVSEFHAKLIKKKGA